MTLFIIFIIFIVLLVDRIKKYKKEKYRKMMLDRYLDFRKHKWEKTIDILIQDTPLTHQEIDRILGIDLAAFDPKYKDILYQELVRIKQQKGSNLTNWKILKSKLLVS